MSKQEYISRYLILINYLKRGQALWADILHHLETQSEIAGYNYVIVQRTFQRDITEIRSILKYDIQNNKATGYYFIAESEEEENENSHLLDSFNLFNAMSDSKIYIQINNIFDRLYSANAIGEEFFPGAERNFAAGFKLGL